MQQYHVLFITESKQACKAMCIVCVHLYFILDIEIRCSNIKVVSNSY